MSEAELFIYYVGNHVNMIKDGNILFYDRYTRLKLVFYFFKIDKLFITYIKL